MIAPPRAPGPRSHDEAALCAVLAGVELFSELRDAERLLLLRQMTRETAAAGAVLMREGDPADRMLVLLEGEVVVLAPEGHEVGRAGPGQVVGDWGVLMARARSATVQAATDLRFLALSSEACAAFLEEDRGRALGLLRGADNVVRAVTRTTARLSRELATSQELRARNQELMRLAVAAIASLSAYTLLLDGIRSIDEGLSSYTWLNVPITLAFGGLVLWLVRRSPAPLADFGLTWAGGRRAALEGLGVALLMGLGGLGARAVPVLSEHVEPRLLVLQVLDGTGPSLSSWLSTMGLYCLVIAPVQELVVRGVLQSSLERLGTGRWRRLSANIVANVIFATTHLVYSHTVVGLVFCFGMVLGTLSSRHKTLVGAVVAHCIGGALLLWGVGLVGVE